MNKQTKIALIGLVILVLFFAGTVGLGFRAGNDKKGSTKDEPPIWTKWLGKVLPSPIPSVTLKEMGLNGKGNRLTITERATITFLPSKEKHRKVDVKWISDAPVTLKFKDNLPPDIDEKPENPTIGTKEKENRIVVSRAGGSLTLTTLEQSSAKVEFEKSPAPNRTKSLGKVLPSPTMPRVALEDMKLNGKLLEKNKLIINKRATLSSIPLKNTSVVEFVGSK